MSRKDPPRIDHPYIFSVSQAETFRMCPRKWAYLKIDGLEDPGNDSSKLGGLVHDQIEKYLENGVPIKTDRAGKIAMSGLPHLPPPRFPGMRIEEWFHVKIGNYQGKRGVGAYYRGLKDVEILEGWKSSRPLVSDHKTTKNFMWAKSERDLTGGETGVGDVQAGVYAYDAILKTSAKEIDLQWTYMRTTGPPVGQPSYAIITAEQVGRIIAELELTTAEMIRTKDEHPTASTVEQDPKGCDAFGGCPFQGKCKLKPKEKLRAIMSQANKENSVLAKLKKRKAAKLVASDAPATEKEPPPTEEREKPILVAVSDETKEDAPVNPPENATAPVVTPEDKDSKAKKPTNRRATTKPKKQAATELVASPNASVVGRAVDAFWGVIADDIASRIAGKLGK